MQERIALSLNEAASACGVSHWSLRKAISSGKLKPMRVGRKILVSPEELRRFLNGNRRK
jgi:excisionase family DNA binding protein